MEQRFRYAVKLVPAEEGGFIVTCRDIPQFATQGDTKALALVEAADAMDEVFAAYVHAGLSLPQPSKARENEVLVSPTPETVKFAIEHANISKMTKSFLNETSSCPMT